MKSTHTFPRSRRSAEHVLDLLAGLLDLRLRLIGLALRLELAVSRGLAGGFLRLALGGLCCIAGLVPDFAHLDSSVALRAVSLPDTQQMRARTPEPSCARVGSSSCSIVVAFEALYVDVDRAVYRRMACSCPPWADCTCRLSDQLGTFARWHAISAGSPGWRRASSWPRS